MYRRSDPRWNRTIQHITENIEHANESAQENIYSFTQRYINPCLSSINECVGHCTAPCFPAHNDRRRHRGRSRGRAELSFDFYDDWEEEEADGLLGWGSDNLDRFLGSASTYGTTSQPGRQRGMSYGQRNRDPRFNTARRKSVAQVRDGGPDPTIIPSSSYFGFLGRLPFKIGGKGLRYKPSAADLTEHPGVGRRSFDDEDQPLIEDSEEEGSEHKGHRRQRSDTRASATTTDSLSSRGDIFPSEDELDDAVPLDDEFAMVLERRTTGHLTDDSSNKARSKRSKRPSESHKSLRSGSHDTELQSTEEEQDPMQRSVSELSEYPTLDDLQREEDHLRQQEELAVARKRKFAHNLAIQRGLASETSLSPAAPPSILRTPSPVPRSPALSPSNSRSQVRNHRSPSPSYLRSPVADAPGRLPSETHPFPSFVDSQTMPDSSSFYVDESDYNSSMAPTPQRPLSVLNQERDGQEDEATTGKETKEGSGKGKSQGENGFIGARLPNFGTSS